MPMDIWTGSRELRVVCILLHEAQVKLGNDHLAEEIRQFLAGIVKEKTHDLQNS